jgi:hypothetical protein
MPATGNEATDQDCAAGLAVISVTNSLAVPVTAGAGLRAAR